MPKTEKVSSSAFLPSDTFQLIVANTPLVSIDLIVRNHKGQVLLGKRVNRPALGMWFVPGGRVLKGESLRSAFARLTEVELGIELDIQQATYLGLYEHFYEDSIFTKDQCLAENPVSTHYVVNAFEITLLEDLSLPYSQHNSYRWFDEADLLLDSDVHRHTRWYFQKEQGFHTASQVL